MSRSPSTSTLTMEFGHELEQERHAWLRRRFMWYCAVMFGYTLLSQLGALIAGSVMPVGFHVVNLTVSLATLGTYAAAYRYIARSPKPKIPPLKLASAIVLGLGMLWLASTPIVTYYTEQQIQAREGDAPLVVNPRPGMALQIQRDPAAIERARIDGDEGNADLPAPLRRRDFREVLLAGIGGLSTIFAAHFFACIFLPWTATESLRPIWPLLVANALMTAAMGVRSLLHADPGPLAPLLWLTLGFIAASLVTPMPGLAVCWWRHTRFRRRATFDVLRDRYSALKHELTSARQIHESLFPKAISSGDCLFCYEYEPMRQIGGDYLHAFASPAGSASKALSLVLVDVTGHGIPAALTVNRLHGELARIFAENPDVPPGDVLRLLNSYVHLTLATHSVYVTAICFRACAESNTLEYASGGHPPAFLRSVDGRIERLDSTSLVLGVAAGPDFHPEPQSVRFGPGDVLVAYTDGATEARDERGRYFGIEGIQKLLAVGQPDAVRGWPGALRRAVEQYREGPTMDDVLVIELRRAIERVAG